MVCPACGLQHFPRVAPAIIVLIHRDRELLLGRSPRFPEGVFSTIAGFVDPGESLEEAVRREVFEETGVTVSEPTYFGSQPWPFPHSLMVGFLAEWEGGEIVLHDGELEDARWFDLEGLPLLPTPMSIARWMIDAWLARFPGPSVDADGPPPEAWDR
jgi:NAD+ diphosphatase